ncbi:centromere protein J isoform X2 [Salvelinus sp. IW2-2015]|uniref:centromere protein J isoform X2 n=1 Tax=Salvelinus sp. IW2-2015 TaxID=2691554 RepID=UPI000CDF5E47|nr:centromere protein J isoform X2 [Salvelinus alpinus]
MSSPAGLQAQQSQTKFLDRWMTSSSCAGVILNPSPDLAESLRHSSVWRSRDVNDSFASQFVPLPVSSSSSSLSISSLVHDAKSGTELSKQNQLPVDRTLSDRQFAGLQTVASQGLTLPGEMDSMEKFVEQSQDLPLMLKLERLRQWQQHMQEQLKAHQLEELVSLQEEQQRLLGMVHVAQQDGSDYIEISKSTGADWGDNTLLGGYPLSHRPPAAKSFPIGPPQGPASSQLWRQGPTFRQPPRGQEQEKDQTLGTEAWSNPHKCHQLNGDADDRGEDEEVTLSSHSAPSMTEDYKAYRGDDCELDSQDRPIKPGIGGQTFEALLEEQLRLEEQRLKTTQQQQSPEAAERASPRANTKRAFLRRGEGLSRFTNRSKAPMPNRGGPQKDPKPRAKVSTRWTSEPTQKVSQRPPVQRKTAVLNKENRPRDLCSPLLDSVRPEGKADKPAAVRPRVLGSHQRQNIEMTNCLRPREVISNKVGGTSQPVSRTPAAVTKQFGLEERTGALQRNGNGPSRPDGAAEGKSGVPEYSFELSFQEKLQHWDCDRQKESVELGEFELLEQAAEELSFSSNSSFVMKVLQLDQQHPLQGSRGSHPRRLSSTPIKSPSLPKGVHSRGTSRSGQGTGTSLSVSPGVSAVRAKGVMRENSKATDEDEEEEDEVCDGKHEEISDILFHSSSEFRDREEVARPSYQTTVSSNLWENPLPASNPPYDKRSYQDREGGSSQAEEGGESDLDDSTLLEDREEGDHESLLVFDDDDTWNDLEEAGSIVEDDSRTRGAATGNRHTPTETVNDISPSERTLKRKVAVAKGAELERMSVITAANQEPDPPPASQLMARLFPSLKPKTQAPSPPEPRKTEDGSGQQQSRQLRERLVELELEIERFRTENAALSRLRQENEKNQEKLRKECAEFDQRKAEELAKFEEFKREETKKLQKERKVFERHASAARAIPDKRERDEIQKQLSFLQEELKRRESRWSTTHNRLRQQIDSLSSDNSNLKDEVRTMEKLRLSTWRKIGTDSERENERREKERGREGPRPLDSYIALEAKCLKLASPPDTVRSSQPQSSISSKGSPSGHSPTTQGGIRGILKRSGPTPAPSPAHSYSSEDRPESLTRSHHPAQSHDDSNNLSPRARGLQTETEVKEQQEPGQDVLTHSDGKMERVLACGGRLIIFPNGTRKEVSADGLTVKVTFFNGDIKQVMADQRVIYYYADAQTTHTTYPDGIEVLQFPNNQTEKHFPDGRKEITFPDQTVKNLYPDGREESVLTDGTIIQVNLDGSKEIQFNTGQKEIHTADYKRREYPDGTLKTVYTDGRQETRYPTGRLRLKDKDGNIVMDNRP